MRTRETTSGTGPVAVSYNRTIMTDANNGLEYPGQPTTVESTVEATVAGSTLNATFKDVVTPNFRKRIAAGEVINNPMESESILEIEPPINIDFDTKTTVCSYDHSDWSQHFTVWAQRTEIGQCSFGRLITGAPSEMTTYPEIPDIDMEIQKRIDIAVARAFANISHSEILILASLAESKSTVAGLIQFMSAAYKIIDVATKVERTDFRKLNRLSKKKGFTTRKLKKALDDTAEVYMNARYNLRPLYYDICGILKLFNEKPKNDRYTFRGYSEWNSKDSNSAVFTNSSGLVPMSSDGTLDFKIFNEVESKVSARAGVLTRLEDASIWSRAGINSIPETMWDLVPFSFIVDWFCTIGDTILAWTPVYGSTVLTSWVTAEVQHIQRQKVVVNDCVSGLPPIAWRYPLFWTDVSCTLGEASRQKITKKKYRIVNPQRPILPSIDVSLDLLQLVDLTIICKKLLLNRKIMTGVV